MDSRGRKDRSAALERPCPEFQFDPGIRVLNPIARIVHAYLSASALWQRRSSTEMILTSRSHVELLADQCAESRS